jgi:hypothetical protein
VNTEQRDVDVRISSFSELANTDCPLALDNYQRAFVWGDKKINLLLDDLHSFIETISDLSVGKGTGQPQNYYMGALLIHHQVVNGGPKRFVIDGQQRLTSLAVLYWLLNEELPHHMQLSFRSTRSMANIQQAKETMKLRLKERPLAFDVFRHLSFTVITVQREDLAFTFFDTQNNRGVPLGGTDLLKAYHLRAIADGTPSEVEQLQSHCAKRWEQVQLHGGQENLIRHHDFAPELFHYYLWRGRNWTGSKVVELESHDELLNHFGDESIQSQLGEVALYPAGSNQWGEQIRLTANNEYQLQPAPQNIGNSAAYLPLALRQPISRGVGFFLYAEKYAALLNSLLHKGSDDPEITAVQKFNEGVVKKLSAYLQSLYRLAWLAYFDRLGSQGLLRFVLWLDHRLGAIRLGQNDIRRETPIKFLRDQKQNLLDIITYAYRGEDVVSFLQQTDVSQAYGNNNGWKEAITSNRKVQERYAAAVAAYYGITELAAKAKEIDGHVITTLSKRGVKHD